MNRRLLVSCVILCISIKMYADDIAMPAFFPQSPRISAQGSSFTAIANGYESLFTNPAGFAMSDGEFTIIGLNPWIYGKPSPLMFSLGLLNPPASYKGPDTTFSDVSGKRDYFNYTVSGGTGLGASVGIGYTGKGLGLGFINHNDLFFISNEAPELTHGYFLSDFALIGGLAFTPVKRDRLSISLGADLRPSVRFYSPINASAMLSYLDASGAEDPEAFTALNTEYLYQGAALGMDAGIILTLDSSFRFGFTARDIAGTRYTMARYSLGDWLDSLQGSGLPGGSQSSPDSFYVPMSFNLGAAWYPQYEFITRYCTPVLHASMNKLEELFKDTYSPVTLFHAGTEITVFKRLKLRAGLNQGYLSYGAGVSFSCIDLNFAAFTRELGYNKGEAASRVVSVEFAIRL